MRMGLSVVTGNGCVTVSTGSIMHAPCPGASDGHSRVQLCCCLRVAPFFE